MLSVALRCLCPVPCSNCTLTSRAAAEAFHLARKAELPRETVWLVPCRPCGPGGPCGLSQCPATLCSEGVGYASNRLERSSTPFPSPPPPNRLLLSRIGSKLLLPKETAQNSARVLFCLLWKLENKPLASYADTVSAWMVIIYCMQLQAEPEHPTTTLV